MTPIIFLLKRIGHIINQFMHTIRARNIETGAGKKPPECPSWGLLRRFYALLEAFQDRQSIFFLLGIICLTGTL
jgi:hypothetical protein